MSKVPPYAVLLATLGAIVCVIVVDSQAVIASLGMPALLAVLLSAKGRRTLGLRLLVSTPLLGVALALRFYAQERELLLPALRVVSAIAWASCLAMLLGPREMREALGALGAPPALVELIGHTRHFASQLTETATEAWNAAALRAGLRSLRTAQGTVGQIAGVTVVRAFDRAECVAIALALRGGHLAEHGLLEEQPASQAVGDRP